MLMSCELFYNDIFDYKYTASLKLEKTTHKQCLKTTEKSRIQLGERSELRLYF